MTEGDPIGIEHALAIGAAMSDESRHGPDCAEGTRTGRNDTGYAAHGGFEGVIRMGGARA
jgi:hypothetical protein